jgi:hypothetical protein
MRPVSASAIVEGTPDELFRFLSRLENHFRLSDGSLRLISVRHPTRASCAARGLVEIRGPLGLSRLAVTCLPVLERPHRLAGTAHIGRRTWASIVWVLEPWGTRTRVALVAEVRAATPVDRLLLVLGGRTWLRRRFMTALRRLDQKSPDDDAARCRLSPSPTRHQAGATRLEVGLLAVP